MKQVTYIYGGVRARMSRRQRRELLAIFVFGALGCFLVVATILYLNGQVLAGIDPSPMLLLTLAH